MGATGAPPLAVHSFVRGMADEHVSQLSRVARYIAFPARHRLFEEGGRADRFWLLETGQVALDVHVPGYGLVIIETLGRGEVIGWSWLFPPYQWQLGAVTIQPTQAFELDGPAVCRAVRRRSGPQPRTHSAVHTCGGASPAGNPDAAAGGLPRAGAILTVPPVRH
jgi:hypothetical protein